MIKEAIRELAKSDDEVYSSIGQVISVDKTNNTIDVQPVNDDAEVLEVRLQSQIASDKGIVIYPAIDSLVIITWVNQTMAYVAMCEEVEEVSLTVGNQKFKIDASGIAHKSGASDLSQTVMDLMTLINDLLTNLKSFKVICSAPGSPSGAVFPDNLIKLNKSKVDLNNIETAFKQLLNGY